MKKYPRTLRNPALRAAVYYRQRGLCALCGEPMGADVDMDHIVPWSKCPRTNLFEIQATHRACNRRKGALMSQSIEPRINIAALRPGSQRVHKVLEDRLLQSKNPSAFVLPCRYGKSDLQRVCAVDFHQKGIVCCTVSLVPSTYLRGQLVAKSHMLLTQRRYSLPRFAYAEIKSAREHFNPNGEVFLAMTTQFVHANLESVVHWVDHALHVTALPPLFFVDECHTVAESQKWGDTIAALISAGARVVLLTGTASRADGMKIPGFDYREMGVTNGVRRSVTLDPEDPDMWLVQLQEVQEKQVVLVPHHEVTYEQAWEERVLCGVTRFPMDCNVHVTKGARQGEPSRLADLSPSEARLYLGRVVRQPETMETLCSRALDLLMEFKTRYWDRIAMIVYCGNDSESDSEVNAHARAIEKTLRALSPAPLTIDTVTSSDGKDGPDRIRKFCEPTGVDILIVKQMVGVGLDAARVKVVLDLSPVRTFASAVQRWLRLATPLLLPNGAVLRVAVLVTPDDCIAGSHWGIMDSQQGQQDTVRIVGDTIEIIHVPRKDDPAALTEVSVSDFRQSPFSDHAGRIAEADILPMIALFAKHFPALGLEATAPQMAAFLTEYNAAQRRLEEGVPTAANAPVDMYAEVSRVKYKINKAMKDVRRIKYGINGDAAEDMRRLYNLLWRRAGMRFQRFDKVNDLAVVQRLHAAARTMIQNVTCDGFELDDDGFVIEDAERSQ